MRTRWLALIGALFVACADPAPALTELHVGAEARAARNGIGTGGDFVPPGQRWQRGPCARGSWGAHGKNPLAIHVREDGSDVDGTGTAERPFASIARALDAADALPGNGVRRIAVGPGAFPTALTLDRTSPKVHLTGCSADETVLQAVGVNTSVLDVRGNRHAKVEGVSLFGGRRTVRVRDDGALRLIASRIDAPVQAGLLVEGAQSRADLRNTTIVDPVVLGGLGWGIATIGGTVRLEGGGVHGATGLGLFAEGGAIEAVDLEVLDTAPSSPNAGMGRALHAQFGTDLKLVGGLFQGNADAAVFLLEPGKVVIDQLVIDFTSAGIVIDFPSTGLTGDGIVIVDGDQIQLTNNAIVDAERAGLLIHDASVEASGNETSQNGLRISGFTKFAQRGGTAHGDDADEVLTLTGTLPIDDRPFGLGALLADD